MPHSEEQVLIVGAGPIGMTLAIMLALNEVPCRIIDKREKSTELLRAIGISKSSEEIFFDIGVLDSVRKLGIRVKDMWLLHDSYGEINFYLDGASLANPGYLHVYQPTIEKILSDKLYELNVVVERKCELVKLQNEKSYVAVEIIDEKSNLQKLNYKYLVGCDGASGIVRSLAHIQSQEKLYEYDFVLADVSLASNANLNQTCWHINQEGYLVIIPGPERRARIIFSVKHNHEPIRLTAQYLGELIKSRITIDLKFIDISWETRARFRHSRACTGQNGRIFLAGDAYHVFSPIGGVNMNFGFQDAESLSRCLSLVYKKNKSEYFLEEYARERDIKISEAIEFTEFLSRLMTQPTKNKKLWAFFIKKLKSDEDFKKRLLSYLSGVYMTKRACRL